jgi:signal transduction histidine kinase
LRRYASEYLDDLGIPFTFDSPDDNSTQSIGGEKRRNIFLVFKETLHNSAKHSKASRVDITISTEPEYRIQIVEVGSKGFVPGESPDGNGLLNCRKRIEAVDGHIQYKTADAAMHISITVPIQANVHG